MKIFILSLGVLLLFSVTISLIRVLIAAKKEADKHGLSLIYCFQGNSRFNAGHGEIKFNDFLLVAAVIFILSILFIAYGVY